MGFLKNLFNKKQKQTIENNDNIQQQTKIYVDENMADEIVKSGGLLITEYYKHISSQRELYGRYPERDRLQALFSDCVVLAASYAKEDDGDSGSRYAMETAKKYGIRRAVMYNPQVNMDDAMFNLNRQIYREDSAVILINKYTIFDAIDKILGNNIPSDTLF